MRVTDAYKNEVLNVRRPFTCCWSSCEVFGSSGSVLGEVKQEHGFCCPDFYIKDQNGEKVLRIVRPICLVSCFGDVSFNIVTMDGDEIGRISKQWSGLAKEIFTDADNFGISFPLDLQVELKAVLLSACLLIVRSFYYWYTHRTYLQVLFISGFSFL